MKKYLGIIKEYEEQMGGINVKLLTKTYNTKKEFSAWFFLHPNSEHTILENNEELDSMFEIFRDMTPLTEEEKEEMAKAKSLYKRLIQE